MADRQTRVIGGNGSSVQAFALDPGLLQYVQSVFVQVDNSGGGAIKPTLTVQTNNGQPLAKQRQGRSIPAGDSGSATWALRLADEIETAFDPIFTATLQIGSSGIGDILFTSADFGGNAGTVANGFAAFQIVGTWTVAANAPLVVTVTNFGAAANFAIGACNVQTIGATTRELLTGGVVLIPNGFTSFLKLDTHVVGAVVMNLAAPTSPKFINAGTYAVTVTLNWLAI